MERAKTEAEWRRAAAIKKAHQELELWGDGRLRQRQPDGSLEYTSE